MIRLLRLFTSLGLLTLVVLGGMLAMNLWTFQRFTDEQSVAQLSFSRLADDAYTATLATSGGDTREYVLKGDEWQLDARMIIWSPWIHLLGRDPLYRLDRLSGRYRDIEQAQRERPSIHALSENPGLDLWALARDGYDWLPGVDGTYGSAVYLPMSDGASYEILLTQKAIIARPVNAGANAAISQWY